MFFKDQGELSLSNTLVKSCIASHTVCSIAHDSFIASIAHSFKRGNFVILAYSFYFLVFHSIRSACTNYSAFRLRFISVFDAFDAEA